MARIHDHYGRVDVLVNNAGIIEVGPFEVMTLNDFRTAMETHFGGPVYRHNGVVLKVGSGLPERFRIGQGFTLLRGFKKLIQHAV